MKEPEVNRKTAANLGLLDEEYDRIVEILGRVPTHTELGMFGVMWSEHCSYKNSIAVLKTLPRTGKRLLAAAGEENAGLVDIGDGLAVAFKIESHNHPSAIEPYQGAATGVGGILRDIFTMGARPIAMLNSLRFGDPGHQRVRYIAKGVVKGIADYGNSFGVPTVAGEVYFDDCYNENPLVNAMAVGIVEVDSIAHAIARGEGNSVMIVGSSTGRDGIHGATFASEEITGESDKKRPSVQVGDPFTEKLLLEATLEAIQTGHVIGIQDMGAAGITCSSSEMSARGECGMVIDLASVPVREQEMTPYEIMLSESQERMLMVVEAGYEKTIQKVYAQWDIRSSVIGHVVDNDKLTILHGGQKVAEIPANSLVLGGGAPVYHREAKEPPDSQKRRSFDTNSVPEPEDLGQCLLKLIGSPNLSSKKWIWEQYDSMVRTNTLAQTADASVLRIKGTNKALSVKTDCNARYVFLNPRRGGSIAVAEAARNVVCTGAVPIAITNCLNFGNPYNPEVFWQFKEAVAGISEACRVLDTPVTGGNVSFYNESPIGPVFPTPVIGMLGLISSVVQVQTAEFKDEGDIIILLGATRGHIGGAEYLKVCHGIVAGDAPPIDLNLERNVQSACLSMTTRGLVKSAHDVSDGGLAVSLVESCVGGYRHLGARVKVESQLRSDFYLFAEDQSRIVISANPADVDEIMDVAGEFSVPVEILGEVVPDRFSINSEIELEISRIAEHFEHSLEDELGEGLKQQGKGP